jgi:hypothetical protein
MGPFGSSEAAEIFFEHNPEASWEEFLEWYDGELADSADLDYAYFKENTH